MFRIRIDAYMRLRTLLLFVFFLSALTISCRKAVSAGPDTIPYVKNILNDRTGYEFNVLSSSSDIGSKGTVAIVDNPMRATSLCDVILNCDFFENIDGKPTPDLLPDFAGETVVALIDSSFDAKMSLADSSGVRELAVKSFISVLDTAVRAKAVIFSSPLMAVNAAFDVDSLKHFFGLDVPVIYPVKSASEYVKSTFGQDASTMVVTNDESMCESGRYDCFFSHPYVVCVPDQSDSLSFRTLLTQYASCADAGALDAVVLDDYMTEPAAFLSEIDEIINVESPENLALRQLISVKFEVVDCRDMAAKACYWQLRNHNMFTHNVAYPIGLTLNVQN